jgi:BlaI family penicillinase repressor
MPDMSFGDRELDVMAVLWEIGSGTVAEVREKLSARLAYTTVLTILRNLEAKQFVSHRGEGRAHRYYPRVARRSAQKSALSRVVDALFQGSHERLLAHLVDEKALDPDELQHLAREVRERGRERGSKRRAP